MIANINKELIELIRADGYTNITQAIGADRK
jgi:dihydroorotate dehydrogenase